jgi:hypothetical protein
MKLETGDILLTSKNSIVVKFMRVFQKDPVYWGHAMVAKDESTLWEASWTIREITLDEVLKKKRYYYYKVIRKKDLTDKQKELMRQVAPKLLGHFYSVGRIVLQALDEIFCTHWFTDEDTRIFSQVCSSFVAWVYEMSCRYKFNELSWASCDPDDIEDDQEKHPEIWKVVEERDFRRRK